MTFVPYNSLRRVQQKPGPGRFAGIIVVILLHVAIIYGAIIGLGRDIIKAVVDPIQVDIVEELPPPQELPPPPPPPTLDTPPPPFIPPPEVQVAQPPPPQTTAPTVVQNTAPVEAPPVSRPAPPPPAPAPVAAPARTPASLISKSFTRPEYPSMSIRLEEEGSVTLAMTCTEDGYLRDPQVQQSSGSNRLDAAAVSEGKRGRWRCTPGTVDGKPETSKMQVRYTFRLEDAR